MRILEERKDYTIYYDSFWHPNIEDMICEVLIENKNYNILSEYCAKGKLFECAKSLIKKMEKIK